MAFLKYVIILSLFPVGIAQADIYKCVIKGKTTFSQQPCATDAVKVEVNTYQPSAEEKSRANEAMQSNKDFSEGSDRKYKIMNLKRMRAELKQDIKKYQASMDLELQALKQKKNYASNNLAGATWEDSISSEMLAVSKTYESRISNTNTKIDRVSDEISDLESK
jgi:predicted RNase H-like nuclease (RuvC/YqgF family)